MKRNKILNTALLLAGSELKSGPGKIYSVKTIPGKQLYFDVYLLNIFLLLIYFFVFANLKIGINENIMFSSDDSKEYLATAKEFFNFSETGFSITRPFLFPLILSFSYSIFGPYGFWLLQFIFWILSINLFYFAIKKLTRINLYGIIGCILLGLNLSYIVETFHGLTEVVTIFLLSLLIYIFTSNITRLGELRVFHRCLLILVLLVLIKPLFLYPLIFLLFIVIPLYYFPKYLSSPKQILFLLLIIIPIIFQVSIMKIKYNHFTVSEISSITLKRYLLAQGIQKKNNIDLEEAQLKAEKFTMSEAYTYILNDKIMFAKIFYQNLKDNIRAYPAFLIFPVNYENKLFIKFTTKMNEIYYYLHIIFVLPVLFFLVYFFIKKNIRSLIIIVLLGGLNYYILITSAISSWQGDRLVLPALPIFLFLYLYIIMNVNRMIKLGLHKIT
jgi:hypothetical protein